MQPIRGVILDIDGTLLDSNDAHARAWRDACAQHGYARDLEEVRRLIGMGSDKLLPALLSLSATSAEGRRITETRGEIFTRDYFEGLKPFPDATRLVREFADRGLGITVASSSGKDDLLKFLRLLEIEDLIDSKTSGDDTENSKPAPDLIEAALKKLEMKPSEVVMLGDTPYDILAAKSVGVRTIALRSGGWNDRALYGCAEIYDDPAHLLKNLERSLLFTQKFEDSSRLKSKINAPLKEASEIIST